jgi:hypothetical protein
MTGGGGGGWACSGGRRWPQQWPSTRMQMQQTPMPLTLQMQWPRPGGGQRPPGPGFPPKWPQPGPRDPQQPPPRTPGRVSGMDEGVNSHALHELTDDSGGRTEIVKEVSDLGPSTASIADELSRQYSLAYEPTAKKDGRWHTIRLDPKNRDYKVRARRGYMATP